ncbi:hypothetical protein S245_031294, partial [Arachis hypogaea]
CLSHAKFRAPLIELLVVCPVTACYRHRRNFEQLPHAPSLPLHLTAALATFLPFHRAATVRTWKPSSRRFPTSPPPPHSNTGIQPPTPKTQTLGYSPTAARVSLNATSNVLKHHRVFARSSAALRFFLIQQLVRLPRPHEGNGFIFFKFSFSVFLSLLRTLIQ